MTLGKQFRMFRRKLRRQIFKSSFLQISYPVVDLFYWQPSSGANFGDELSRTIVELMLARKGFTLFDEVSNPRRLITVGSILHYSDTDTVVWGSGKNGTASDNAHFFDRLDVRALRGPRTQEYLKSKGIASPDVFGDPALLLPLLTNGRFKPSAMHDVAFVPNLNDYVAGLDCSKINIPIIDPRQSWNKVVAEIIKYKMIVASSLHGIIIAEAFGIPARYVRLTEREHLFKYHDYYEGTGRHLTSIPTSIAQAIEMGGERPPVVDLEKLLASFPYDLWE